jgi:hypothetical protein
MDIQLSVSEIVDNAAQLNQRDFEHLIKQMYQVRAKRTVPSLSKEETDLLKKINEGFKTEKWKRLAYLDDKMEMATLTNKEAEESLILAEELEAYTVQRFIYLKKLALLRNITIDQLMIDLEIITQ